MSLISKAISNLFNGVSQQPASLRHPTQCETMDNAYPSIATGTRKRPPTKHKAQLKNSTATDACVHVINKSATERYAVVITSGNVEVFDADTGAAHMVTFPDGTGYLTSTTPRTDFVAMTSVDYTFIVNRTVTVAMTAAVVAGTLKGTKQQFSALPATPAVGDIWRISGTPDFSFTAYYVIWDGNVWVETANPGITYQLDSATMPWKLIKTGPTTWECRKIVWANRLVGDAITCPQPSFVGATLRDIFYHRGRLGVISDDNVILSRAGAPFTFWATSVTAILDNDPVDRSVTSNEVSVLNHVVPFNKTLMLFSDLTQFQFSAGDLLTPKNPAVDPVTQFASSSACRPISAGNAMFFAQAKDNSTAIREYYVDVNTVSNDATDISAHVPTYVPKDAFLLASSTSEDVLFMLSLAERNKVWVYKYFWGEKDGAKAKLQSAWCRFIFDAGDTILGMEFIGNSCVFVIQRSDGVYLERMELQANTTDGALGFLVHLDRRCELTGVYDAANDWTTWTLPYADAGSFAVVLSDAFGVDAGNALTVTRPSATTVRSLGNWSAGTCYVGRNYTMTYGFSTIYERDQSGVAVTNGKLKLRRMYLTYQNTGYFRAEVIPKGRVTYTYEFTGKYVGTAAVGSTTILNGTFAFPIGCENKDATINIVSDSYLPCFIQSAEWEGEFTIKSSRQ